MKKIVSIILVLVTILSMGTMAFADGTTTLTTTVPPAKYTLNIPADTVVPFGADVTELGNITVTDSEGFAYGKDLKVTVTYDAFKAESPDINTTIPFKVLYDDTTTLYTHSSSKSSGGAFVFLGRKDGTVESNALCGKTGDGIPFYVKAIGLSVSSSDWGKALAGDYTASITFTSEVVVEG